MTEKYIPPSYLSWDTLLAKRGKTDSELSERNRMAYKRFLVESNKEVDLISTPYTSDRPFKAETQEYIFAQDLAFTIWLVKKEVFDQADVQLIGEKRKSMEMLRKDFIMLLKSRPTDNPRSRLAVSGVDYGLKGLENPLDYSDVADSRFETWRQR